MREIHLGLPAKSFSRPDSGVIDVTVCSQTGLLKTSACPGDITLPFLEGTQPTAYCDVHSSRMPISSLASLDGLRLDTLSIDDDLLGELRMPELQQDILQDLLPNSGSAGNRGGRQTGTGRTGGEAPYPPDYEPELPNYNPLLD
jgi:penicillin-binding protein 1A